MRREIIRSCPDWMGDGPRHDCIFVSTNPLEPDLRGFTVARVKLLFSFMHHDIVYPCALVHWYEKTSSEPDPITGLWKVAPEFVNGEASYAVIHVETILRAAHLMPVFTSDFTPSSYKYTDTLDNYGEFFVNKYIDGCEV